MSEQEQGESAFYNFGTVGTLIERDCRVAIGGHGKIRGLRVACVTDVANHSDGSQAVIIDGAGFTPVLNDLAAALVGSRLSNGDTIFSTPREKQKRGIFVEEGSVIPGLFDPDWTPPPHKQSVQFAVNGSTAARDGVLREVSSDWNVDDTYRKEERKDRRFCRVPRGNARAHHQLCIPIDERNRSAILGSLPDNDDVITDKLHRDGRLSTVFIPIDEQGVAIAQE